MREGEAMFKPCRPRVDVIFGSDPFRFRVYCSCGFKGPSRDREKLAEWDLKEHIGRELFEATLS